MSTKNKQTLVQALGVQYINEFFRGAMFSRGRKVYQIRSCNEESLSCHSINADDENKTWVPENLPSHTLSSFTDIKWPRLGYRNIPAGFVTNGVMFITGVRSVHRGLKFEHLTMESLPVMDALGVGEYGRNADIMLQIFFPIWYKFKEGMSKLDKRDLACFAVNEDVAISLSIDQGPDRYCDVYFRGKVVGSIKENHDIIIVNKAIKRGNLKQLYHLLES